MKFSRRQLLKRVGVAAAASPFVPLLDADLAYGQAAAPKRLILFFTPHGTVWNQWLPTGTESAFTLSPILSPLERHKSHLTILAGLCVLAMATIMLFRKKPVEASQRLNSLSPQE